LVNSGGALQASYKYDPYGRWLSGGGSLASANGLRFSSKPWVGFNGSTTSGLYYYGYRFYDPYLQRWVNRDPLEERGGKNLYAFIKNQALAMVDPVGLFFWRKKWVDEDDPYIWIKGKDGVLIAYNAACIANAQINAINCLKDVGKSGGINLAICVVGCLPTLGLTPPAYGACVTLCLGADAVLSLLGISSCLDMYSREKEACRPCIHSK
jgi:RHS repeat-associated protein